MIINLALKTKLDRHVHNYVKKSNSILYSTKHCEPARVASDG